ncbi:TlpA family protein disulfide reductase [Oerskovia flava]|uniref:TlpA family protein disulfide reductase n=1 Tax=Oerskovia flava TaxID=2986422 RepID=UPI00223EAE8E|nr:redoxin domain-containing protein [Oerskovia sp. JB1-3-2]
MTRTARPTTTTGMSNGTVPAGRGGADYRFERFRTGLLIDDMRFPAHAPGPGDVVPSFDLPTLDGGRFRSDDLGDSPVLLVFGSRTCPVTESAVPVLRALHADLGGDVRFVLVSTREAHPGQDLPQPRTSAQKLAHARLLRDHHQVPFEVAVDDIDGTLHRELGPKPNSAYVLTADGTIRYRAHWANDERGLRDALTRTVAGRSPRRGRSRGMAGPLLRAVGHLPGVVEAAGSQVERDVWRAAAPLALLARVSRLFGRLPLDRRGPAAAVVTAAGVLAAAVVTTALVAAGLR